MYFKIQDAQTLFRYKKEANMLSVGSMNLNELHNMSSKKIVFKNKSSFH